MKPLDELQGNKIAALEVFWLLSSARHVRPYIQGYTHRLPSLVVVNPQLDETIAEAT